jgi:16S rRNA (guanine527-N7)-methyltransferase
VAAPDPSLLAVLEEARQLGLLGPGPVERQYRHALDLAHGIGEFQGSLLDLGSGGGLPGLVLAHEWPGSSMVLLDAQRRRCDFLSRAVATLEVSGRVAVECGRAELLAREPHLRGKFDLVVARSFGPPAVTAECAVGFLRAGGELVVTEPPETGTTPMRWDTAGLAKLGFSPPRSFRVGDTGAVRIHLAQTPEDRWPRRDGVPSKRPLW